MAKRKTQYRESYGHEIVDKPNWAAFYDLVKNEYSKRTKGA